MFKIQKLISNYAWVYKLELQNFRLEQALNFYEFKQV